jgi:hypothetical protein
MHINEPGMTNQAPGARGQRGKKSVLRTRYLLILVSCFLSLDSYAQCAMCRAALQSEGNASKAEAVNDGIVYLMVIPYLLVAAVGYYVYRMRMQKKG